MRYAMKSVLPVLSRQGQEVEDQNASFGRERVTIITFETVIFAAQNRGPRPPEIVLSARPET